MKYILASALFVLVSTACSGTKKNDVAVNEPAQEQTQVKTDGKALVVFFSHAGDNYSVGNIKVGNTKIVADYISEKANVTKGFSMYGHDVRTKKSEVEKWLKGLGYK